MSDGARALIVNADDFGLSAGVDRGIAEAFERGIVTSASLMVRAPDAAGAAAYAAAHPALAVGLHVDLGEWEPAGGGGEWRAVYEVVPLEDGRAVAAEVDAQLDAFRALLGRDPTHLDSHQHVHLREPVRSAVAAAGERLGVPVRHLGDAVRYCGDFYGQGKNGADNREAIGVDALVGVIHGLRQGATELACHPGDDPGLDSVYRDERAVELATLCDPAVRAALGDAGVELRSFATLPLRS